MSSEKMERLEQNSLNEEGESADIPFVSLCLHHSPICFQSLATKIIHKQLIYSHKTRLLTLKNLNLRCHQFLTTNLLNQQLTRHSATNQNKSPIVGRDQE